MHPSFFPYGHHFHLALITIASAWVIMLPGCTSCSEDATQIVPPVTILTPTTPQNIQIVAGDKQAILTWAPVDNTDSYNLYIATEPGVNQQTYPNLANGLRQESVTSPYIIANLENGKPYYLVLTSKNAGGESNASQEITVSPATTIPLPPAPDITHTKIGTDTIELGWDEIPGARKYFVHITYPSDAGGDLAGSTQKYAVESTIFSIAELKHGKAYLIALSAENETGEGQFSEPVSVTTKLPIIRPPPPAGVTVSANHVDKRITINWIVNENIDQYTLIVGTDQNIDSRNFIRSAGGKEIKAAVPPYTLTDLAPKTYYFVLNAKNENGTSYDSKVVNITLEPPPAIPEPDMQPIKGDEMLEPDGEDRPFEKLGANGEVLNDQRNKYLIQPWACVHHKKTGKVWEIKTRDDTFRNWNKTYPWLALNTENCPNNICDAQGYIMKANQVRLCGFNDWRLPTREELTSLLDKNKPYPTPNIDTRFFINTGSHYYWTSTTYEHDSELAWFVYFASGYEYFDLKTNPMHIRLVRDSKLP